MELIPEEHRCENCKWWSGKDVCQQVYGEQWACRRHAPIRDVFSTTRKLWPITQNDNWCGDWEQTG